MERKRFYPNPLRLQNHRPAVENIYDEERNRIPGGVITNDNFGYPVVILTDEKVERLTALCNAHRAAHDMLANVEDPILRDQIISIIRYTNAALPHTSREPGYAIDKLHTKSKRPKRKPQN